MNIFSKMVRYYISNMGSSAMKVSYLRKKGALIGKNVVINGDLATFGTEPYLISCGDGCLFASGVKIVNHDGGVRVLNNLGYFKDKKADKIDIVTLGNNVYVGMNAMIMPGVKIGDNVIIGAHSVVTKDVTSNQVVAGIPAKVICSIEDYYQKNKNSFEYTLGMNYKQKKEFYLNKYKNK